MRMNERAWALVVYLLVVLLVSLGFAYPLFTGHLMWLAWTLLIIVGVSCLVLVSRAVREERHFSVTDQPK